MSHRLKHGLRLMVVNMLFTLNNDAEVGVIAHGHANAFDGGRRADLG
jgi:hypothetical protein